MVYVTSADKYIPTPPKVNLLELANVASVQQTYPDCYFFSRETYTAEGWQLRNPSE